jgi:chemotaxis protein MotB
MADGDAPPVIIIKKKVSGSGHHGGAWKVAYADFVTAMMALFIVLWLLNSKKEVQKAVGGYFKDPRGFAEQTGSRHTGAGSGAGMQISKDNISELKGRLEQLRQLPQFNVMKEQVQFSITEEGLLIELLETEKGLFFESGSPDPTPKTGELLGRLAQECGKLNNTVVIEGHTDALPYAGEQVYGNWELSAGRANAARRIMQSSGLRPNQVEQVRGYADQRLRLPDKPHDPSNRRVTIIVQFEKPLASAAFRDTPQVCYDKAQFRRYS